MNFDINDLLDGGSSSRPRFEGDGGVSDTHVEGSVARIRYSNPPFTVASIRTNAGNLITFVGRFAITEGQTIRLEGVWKKNARFGWQFDAEAFTFNVDATDEAVATFLARHPDMTGIGPARAQAIVEALKATGQDLGEALETGDPAALAAATGEKVTAAMIATAQRAWGAQIDLNKVMLALARWEVTPAAAKRLFDAYGASVVSIIEGDPYWLIGRVRGFGFRRVDDLALRTGIDKMHPSRVDAAIVFALKSIEDDGHTNLGRVELLERCDELLAINLPSEQNVVRAAVDAMIDAGSLMMAGTGEVWRRSLLRAEVEVFTAIEKRVAAPNVSFDDHDRPFAEVLAYVKNEEGDLADRQAEAVARARSSGFLMLCGGAGVGKTYTVRAIVSAYEAAGKRVALAAPTGKAAMRITESLGRDASTIHMLLRPEFGPKRDGFSDDDDDEGELSFRFYYGEEEPLPFDAVIIDEFSMVDVRLMRSLVRALRDETALVLVGDHHQLPSVGPGALLRDILVNYPAHAVVLDKVHRQAGVLKENVMAVLNNKFAPSTARPEKDGDPLGPWYVQAKLIDPAAVKESLRVLLRDRLPKFTRRVLGPDGEMMRPIDPFWDAQVLVPKNKPPLGTLVLNEMIQEIAHERWGTEIMRRNGKPMISPGDIDSVRLAGYMPV